MNLVTGAIKVLLNYSFFHGFISNIFLGVLVLLLALVGVLDGVSTASSLFLFPGVFLEVFGGSFFVGVLTG